MTLRNITIENSVKIIPESEKTQFISRDVKPNTTKNNLLLEKQNKKTFAKN